MRQSPSPTATYSNQLIGWREVGFALLLFLLALIPRLIGLQTFVTADEAKWVYRSAQFWLAVLQGDWANTVTKLKPAVTTMWSAGPGFWVYNRLHENLPFTDFLAAIPEWQVNPAVLHATRIPTILLTCASIVLVYLLLRPVLGRWPAFLAGFLLAFDPLYLAHSRFLHHDAMVTLFVLPSLLLALRAANGGWGALAASAVLGGLAFLTKSPNFFLGVFVGGLFLVTAWQQGRVDGTMRSSLLTALGRFAAWGGISYLTFLVIWPAAWFRPIGLPLDVIFDAVRESAGESDDLFIDLGLFYYPVYFIFYTTVPVLAGLVLWGFQRKRLPELARITTQALFWFALTFIIFMTLSDKRSARYILPAVVAFDGVAAAGWAVWLAHQKQRLQIIGIAALVIVQLLAVIPYAPYYLTYTNPLAGGPLTAPHLIKIGWGEGMDQVGAWLNRQPHPEALRVGADYASTLTPYFAGSVSEPTAPQLDYVVSYIKQRQSGSPPPEILAYYEQVVQPEATVELAGIEYARVYPGPAAHPADSPGPVFAYRSHTHFAPIGQALMVDLIWPAENETSRPEQTLTLRDGDQILAVEEKESTFLSTGESTTTRHQLLLPADTPPGSYGLFYGDQLLGRIEARFSQLPSHFQSFEADFGAEVRLLGFEDYRLQNDQLSVTLAFQAAPKAWADYTVFVHLVDEAGQRLAGHDAQPQPPTGQWLKDEVVLDRHRLTIPAEVSSGTYGLVVGLYRADTGEALGEPCLLPIEVTFLVNRVVSE